MSDEREINRLAANIAADVLLARAEAAESALLEMRTLADERVAAACAADHRALAAETALAELRAKVEALAGSMDNVAIAMLAGLPEKLRALLGPR